MRSSMTPPPGAHIREYWARPTSSVRGSLASAWASASPAPVPSSQTSPMCDRSNRPADPRTARCSSTMPAYWTGSSQPEKSMSRPPRATCSANSGVRRGVPVVLKAGSAGVRERPCELHDLPLRGEGHDLPGLASSDPADLVELVVMETHVATDRLHQVVVDRLVDACPRLHEVVLDGADGRHDADLETGLLLHL